MGPVRTMEVIDGEVGDIVGQSSSGSRLRNLAQVSTARRQLKLDGNLGDTNHLKSNAKLAEVMEMCKRGHGSNNEPFVRCVQAAPEPMCILATNRQLDEMVRNCTDPSHFVSLGVDPTFKLGEFYVTPIVFPLRMLVTKPNGNSPIYLGPMLVHQTQQFSAYNFFASQLVGLRKELSNIRAIGTDGEAPLYDAFSGTFSNAINLRCFSHFKKNIKDKLRSLGFPDSILKEIIKDIFGTKTNDERHLGLVDCFDEKEFRGKLELLKPRWNKLEEQHRLSRMGVQLEPEFHKWFTDEKSHTIVRCMLKGVRVKAGMGQDPDHFYTNMNESMNSTLKSRTDYKAQELRQFVDKMFMFHQSQEKLLKKAVLRNDRWRFRNEYDYLQVDSDKWFSMNEKLQKAHLKKVFSEPLGSRSLLSCNNACTEMTSGHGTGLSVPYDSIINSHRITTDTLKDVWTKAIHLVKNSDYISKVPGQPNTDNRMVASLTGKEPHYISKKSKGQFICSGICHRYATYKICEHIVAACESTGNLASFCDWWKCQKSGPDLDSLALSGLPKGVAGNKGGVAVKRSRRGRQASTTPARTHDRISAVITDNSSSHLSSTQISELQGATYTSTQVTGQPSTPTPQHGTSPYAFQPHGTQPYYIKMLTRKIRICAGCRLGFNNEQTIPPSPYNICVAHEELRQVTPNGKTPFTTKTTVHYHANPSCIWMKNSSFVPQSIVTPPDVLVQLDDYHKYYMMDYFNTFIN